MVRFHARLWIASFWNTGSIIPCPRLDLWSQTACRDQGRVQMFFSPPPLVFLVLRVKKKTKKNKRHRHGSSKTRPQLTTERKPDHAIGSLGLTPPHLTEIDPGPHVRIWDRARSVPDASRSVKGGRVEARAVCDRMSHRGGIKDTLFCFR